MQIWWMLFILDMPYYEKSTGTSFTIYCQLPYVPYHSYSVTVHACTILFHYYKLLESPCLTLSSVGAALHPHDSCSFSFSRILKKREHSGKQGKANYGQVHSPGRQPVSIRVYFWGAGSKLKPILWNSLLLSTCLCRWVGMGLEVCQHWRLYAYL